MESKRKPAEVRKMILISAGFLSYIGASGEFVQQIPKRRYVLLKRKTRYNGFCRCDISRFARCDMIFALVRESEHIALRSNISRTEGVYRLPEGQISLPTVLWNGRLWRASLFFQNFFAKYQKYS
jgi:hypothetical protein